MEIDHLIKSLKSFSLVSFDIFDTLITRRTANPADVFLEIQRRGLLFSDRYHEFAKTREDTEFKLRQERDFSSEVHLDEIYQRLAEINAWDFGFAEAAKAIELSVEREWLAPIPHFVSVLDELRSAGTQVAFISDMYLPRDFIHDVLLDFSILAPEDRLFVSSESGHQKSTGELYRHVKSQTDADVESWCHVGDNLESDVHKAETFGIRAVHAGHFQKNRYESDTDALAAVRTLIGCSRLSRLQNPHSDSHKKCLWDTTCNVSGPLIFAFVNWCIQSAIRDEVKTLYFLARDGQIMYEIAEKIISKVYSGQIEAEYLYASRQSLLLPAMRELDQNELDWIMAPTAHLSVRAVLKRIAFEPEEWGTVLLENGISDFDAHLNPLETELLRAIIAGRGQEILARAQKMRTHTLGYLQQAGVLDQDKVGVVDIGWGGTLQRSISRILSSVSADAPVFGYYFGVTGRKLFKPEDKMRAWFTDVDEPRALANKVYIVPMTELFTAADHGGVVAFQRSGADFEPILRSERNETALEWGLEVQQAAMLKLTDEILSVIHVDALSDVSEQAIAFLERSYAQFLLSPTLEEARAYCAYLDAEDQNEVRHVRLGRPYSFEELKKYFTQDFMHHHNEWRQGSLAISDQKLVRLAYEIATFEAQDA
jgi:HAD superfamily hydrolase (TIGR01549 family)